MEVKIVNITEENFEQVPRPAKINFDCKGCFYWIEKRDAKFDLVIQKKKWFGRAIPRYGAVGKMLLWGKRKKPIGYVQFGPISEFETARMLYRDVLPIPKNGWCITCLSLQKPYQRKKLATRLVNNVLRDLKKRRVKTVDVYEMPRFWENFGFGVVLRDGKKLIMRKEL